MFGLDVLRVREGEVPNDPAGVLCLPTKGFAGNRLIFSVDDNRVVGSRRPEVISPVWRSVVDTGSGIDQEFAISRRQHE